MLDFFVIFSKSGIVLFATVNQTIHSMNSYINKLIKNVILEDRMDTLNSDSMALQYRLDNEFELVFVVGYQKMLTLSYIDKFLEQIQLAFRDKFQDYDLRKTLLMASNIGKTVTDGDQQVNGITNSLIPLLTTNVVDFNMEFKKVYGICYKIQSNPIQHEMRTFEQSFKSKKTVASMIVQTNNNKTKSAKESAKEESVVKKSDKPNNNTNGQNNNQTDIQKKLQQMMKSSTSPKAKKVPKKEPTKKEKSNRVWDLGGKNAQNLDFSKKGDEFDVNSSSIAKNTANAEDFANYNSIDMQPDLEFEVEEEEEDEEEEEFISAKPKKSIFGSFLKTFNYNKVLTQADLEPILNQLRDHLIAKNVASEIATKLCESVSTKLEGQTVNTWTGLKSFVRNALEDSILRILSPNRNINILRDIRAKSSPYTIVFCGVNGVGKSTNLAKIANWLIVNNVRVLVIACDTFRAGAIEQLRTHITALKNIHEKDGKSKVDLFEKGYGKDSAAIAMEGINYARSGGYGCCLVDTAGRMQGNEPLMKQLAKLIKINEPDLTLFVGEALVGNEAVDQLMKFNTALLDNGCKGVTSNASAINGIVLTKFDTIDDQVGAAISMTYITGQPIVFVGVGQTYRDLKQLNAKAVVKALMK
ncbi:signal recognition particle receptor subunit alpha homolog [Oppia nitens]|uniref:signal recognition particle receptor subunit alpha homolog n=1 Tax=Oppia nitens TaxID=1686743 RepID=UPI0023D9FFEE|nr:signal recognition particle receptor subunit alpha homolog [Oppia nitens]